MSSHPFNVPPYLGTEDKYIKEVIANHKIRDGRSF